MSPSRRRWCRKLLGWVAPAILGPVAIGCATNHRRAGPSPSGVTAAPAPDGSSVLASVVAAHNAERSRRRLGPLTLDPTLTSAAQGQADDMARRGRMSHRGGDGSSLVTRIGRAGYAYRAAGENVAAGYDRVEDVMTGWMHSPGHRRNILGEYTQMGVGHAIAPGGASYWCVTFGRPASRESG